MTSTWNPRYVAYARAHGRTPAEMRAHDEDAWPGGRNAGFLCWISERWAEWRKARSFRHDDIKTRDDHADFDRSIGAA